LTQLIASGKDSLTRAVCNVDGPRGTMHRMNPYSEDLRGKIVEALRRGRTKSEAARAFGVSRSSVKRYAKLAEEGRPLAPKKRPGSKPKMDKRASQEAAGSGPRRTPRGHPVAASRVPRAGGRGLG
jgi:transposase-like protein